MKAVTYAENLITIHGLYYDETGSVLFRIVELSERRDGRANGGIGLCSPSVFIEVFGFIAVGERKTAPLSIAYSSGIVGWLNPD